MTTNEKIIVTGFTGITMCKFSDLHKDVEKRLGEQVLSHMFGSGRFSEKVKELYREDFIHLSQEETP